jgi:hypothetical protein
MIIRAGRKHAAFVVGRHILNIAYHLLAERTTYRELGPSYFEQRRAEQLTRRPTPNTGFPSDLNPAPQGCMRRCSQHQATFSEHDYTFTLMQVRST